MSLRLRPEAHLDIIEARACYEERAPGLGHESSRAVDAAIAGLLRFPRAFSKVHGPVRKAVLRRFPYALLFLVEDNDIVVLACFHHRKDPRGWAAPRLE